MTGADIANFDIPIKALDTEGTGLDIVHGCHPYYVVLVDEQGGIESWLWDVDPLTRLPVVKPEDVKEITHALYGFGVVFHNAKYDMHSLLSVGVDVPAIIGWDNVHDTICSGHPLNNRGKRALKARSSLLGIPNDDQVAMKEAADSARSFVMSKIGHKFFPELANWQWAEKGHPHFPSANSGWNIMDAWLPRAFYKWVQTQNPNEFRPTHLKTPKLKKPTFKSSWHQRVHDQGLLNYNHDWLTSTEKYGCRDGERTIILYISDRKELDKRELREHYELNRKTLEPLYDSEQRGANLRLDLAEEDLQKYEVLAEKYLADALGTLTPAEALGLNINSSDQLGKVLYEFFELPILEKTWPKTGDPKPKTDQPNLLKLMEGHCTPKSPPHVFISSLIVHKKYLSTIKALTGYIKICVKRDKQNATVYGTVNPNGTDVTRLSAKEPNTQNISTGEDSPSVARLPQFIQDILSESGLSLRDVYGPSPDWEWWPIDFQQFHPRIFTWLSGDTEMMDVFRQGRDFYEVLAAAGYEIPEDEITKQQRKVGKTVNLADLYDAQPAKLEKISGKVGFTCALREQLPSRYEYISQLKIEGRRQGLVFTTGGYPLLVPPRYGKQDPPYVNYRIQGQEGECVKTAIADCYDYLKEIRTYPLYDGQPPFIPFYVHDEMVFAFPIRTAGRQEQVNLTVPHVQRLGQIMVDACAKYKIEVPVGFEYCRYPNTWGGKKTVDIPITVPRIGKAA